MRRILLATAAVLGTSLGAIDASAQKASMTPDPTMVPQAPGTIVVNLGFRINFYAGIMGNFNNNDRTVTNADGSSTTFKTQPINFGEYARIYPGFDAVAANGLKYGAQAELRQNNGTATSGEGSGNPFWYTAYGYVGSDSFGQIRVGTPVNISASYLTGTNEGFNDGGWDGDVPGLLNAGYEPAWPAYADYGGYQSTTKVVYLSPSFSGFEFGADYEPNQTFSGESSGCAAGVAGPTCNSLSSGNPGDQSRRQNTAEFAARYRGTFGALGIAAFGGYIVSGHVQDGVTPAPGGTPVGNLFHGLSAGQGGIQMTIGGFSFGGWALDGNINMSNGGGLEPRGGANQFAYIAGAQYITGPWTVGVQWFNSWNAGFQSAAGIPASASATGAALPNGLGLGTMNEYGFATGGTYALVPGVALYLSYVWGTRKQTNYDLINNLYGSTSNNRITSQAFALGTQFNW